MKTKRVKKVKISEHPHKGKAWSSVIRYGWIEVCCCGRITFYPVKQGDPEVITPITPSRKE